MIKRIKYQLSFAVIVFFILVFPLVNFNHHSYNEPKEGVILFDIKSYYAYLPATFIYKDLSLGFMRNDPSFFNRWIWPVETPTGKSAILTTMGLSVLYAPFFLIGHVAATISPQYDANGYSFPYHVALQFSTLFYFIIGLIFLRKLLARYFNDKVTALTMFAIAGGTNLFFYVGYAAPMPHGYNFVLITMFVYFLEKWYDKISLKNTVILGLLSGIIALIRPTNIIILLLIPFWRTASFIDIKNNFTRLVKNWYHVALMAAMFILVWVPQFIYWKYVSGRLFYFSYGERSDRFYWDNPQIFKMLFSFDKGWFIYTPIMLLAVIGLYSMYKQKIKFTIPISIYLTVMIYVLSSWWCWWYGGSFGQRSMVDFYGLMALPLAAFINGGFKNKIWRYATVALMFLLVFFNQFNIKQYRNMSLSYWLTNKEAYCENFLKIRPTAKYWSVIMHPDYKLARLGIYEYEAPFSRSQVVTQQMLVDRIIAENKNNTTLINSLKTIHPAVNVSTDTLLMQYAMLLVNNNDAGKYFKSIKIDYYLTEINNSPRWKKQVQKKASRSGVTFEQMALIEANRVYNHYSKKYDQQ